MQMSVGLSLGLHSLYPGQNLDRAIADSFFKLIIIFFHYVQNRGGLGGSS